MKYFVVSDIHGSVACLNMALRWYTEEMFDGILLLGDILYHGPRNDLPFGYSPKEVIPVTNGLCNVITAVRGNCDSEVDQMVLQFPIMQTSVILPLASHTVLMTHGHHMEEIEKYPQCDIVLSGHTHISGYEKSDRWYLNPGSVSIPKGNGIRSYAILSDTEFEVHDISDNSVISKVQF